MKTRSGSKHSGVSSGHQNLPRTDGNRASPGIFTRTNILRTKTAALLLMASVCSVAYAHSDGAKPHGDAKPPAIGTIVAQKHALWRIQPSPADPAIRHALAEVSTRQIERTISTLVHFNNRNTVSSMDRTLPVDQGINAAADWIEAEFRHYSRDCGGCLEVHRDTFTEAAQSGDDSRVPRPTTITNVYAILRGSDPLRSKQMYLVTGHYDSRGTDVLDTQKPAPGANDDASGVAVSLECARVLSQLHLPSTVVFVAVAGEEQGLYGSAHFAQLARSEGWQLAGVLNNDIVGGDTTPGDLLQDKSVVRVFSEGIPAAATPQQVKALTALGGESDSPSRGLARAVAGVAATYFPSHARGGATHSERSTGPHFGVVLEFRRDRFHRGGDHTAFNQEGFAAVRFTEWRENFNHQHQDVLTENGVEHGDLIKFVDFSYVAKVARLNAATLATLAAAPPPPRVVVIENKTLGNDTTLRWNAPEGFDPMVKGNVAPLRYEVVWRATAAPDWEFARIWNADGPSFSVTLPVSKDNVIFGVGSVDGAGHRSLVVIPTSER